MAWLVARASEGGLVAVSEIGTNVGAGDGASPEEMCSSTDPSCDLALENNGIHSCLVGLDQEGFVVGGLPFHDGVALVTGLGPVPDLVCGG